MQGIRVVVTKVKNLKRIKELENEYIFQKIQHFSAEKPIWKKTFAKLNILQKIRNFFEKYF